MSLALEDIKSGGEIDPIDEGTFPAIIQAVVTYGIQPQTDWKTKAPKPSEKRLAISFEFPTEAVEKELEDGTVVNVPRRLTKEYKVSSHKKANLMGLIRAVAPNIKGLDELLGIPVSVTVGRTGTGKAKVAGVASLMKGVDAGELLKGSNLFDFYEPEEEAFKALPSFQQQVIIGADDYDGFAESWLPEESEDY